MVEVNGKDVLVGHSADSAYLPLLRRPRLEARTATHGPCSLTVDTAASRVRLFILR